jgi:predicted phage baseplate assembly protein
MHIPRPVGGGADPETLEQARTNAPRTVLTLDRVVSLTDYQAFAASFAGVAKAIATWSRAGLAWQVFLSVAGPGGTTFAADSETVKSLREALLRRGDPFVPLRIESFHPAPFFVAARVGIDADHLAEKVLAQVNDALVTAFSFDARAFAEAVDLSDVVAVMHSVPGVRSVDIDFLYRNDDAGPSRRERLPAAKPKQLADGSFRLAEILILEKATLTEAR